MVVIQIMSKVLQVFFFSLTFFFFFYFFFLFLEEEIGNEKKVKRGFKKS